MDSAPAGLDDRPQRDRALDPARSVLVQAPAGSGKTTLLVSRFLRLLAEVDEPGRIVAITFTIPAAAEMRSRIMKELSAGSPSPLAAAALRRAESRGWNLPDLPAQLRISTIDAFCRELALRQPLLSGLGGALNVAQHPGILYRQAARRTLESMDDAAGSVREAAAELLDWRDNNWNGLEDQLVDMLCNRDRWMQGFLLDRDPQWEMLRDRLERPFSPSRYSEDEWRIVRASFVLLRHAAALLKVVFAENGLVDFIEVAQIAQEVLYAQDGSPSDMAIALAEGIHHLLVDEFQDTSRRQHQLLASIAGAWPDRAGRTCFVVGDPMQSIYSFRNAEAELFFRVRDLGLEIPNSAPLEFDFVQLTSNFRTRAPLVDDLNRRFDRIFAQDDGSGVGFFPSAPARPGGPSTGGGLCLHLDFVPHNPRFQPVAEENAILIRNARQRQVEEIVAVIQSHLPRMREARAAGGGQRYRVAVLARVKKSLFPIAEALRSAGIAFRAIDLENLAGRQEIRDALALVRAMLNPQDRVAWLGVLRAPWCGLSLAELAAIAEENDGDGNTTSRGAAAPARTARPIEDLLAERIHLLSPESRLAAGRVLKAFEAAARLRAEQPAAALGTWLEQAWLLAGGGATVDRTARANLDLLLTRLDNLPRGGSDIFGPVLSAELESLCALPDPEADPDFGVELMTIHRSKGLEFEAVLIPDLQLEDRTSRPAMLSWLERGLPPGSPHLDDGEVTEFLIAPLQAKGAGKGTAKELVEQARKARERQENRRLLYVAATRAREELHIFARPEFKAEQTKSLQAAPEVQLVEPANSLMAAAWPAIEDEARSLFAKWKAEPCRDARLAEHQPGESIPLPFPSGPRNDSDPVSGDLFSLAAEAEGGTLDTPPIASTLRLRRLPAAAFPDVPAAAKPLPSLASGAVSSSQPLYSRHGGGLTSRALGIAVHSLLEQLAQLRSQSGWPSVRASLQRLGPRIQASIQSSGVDPAQASLLAGEAMRLALAASHDPIAQWILSPHLGAASEVRWNGVLDGKVHSVQIDRVFRSGETPGAEGAQAWWIVDYKPALAPRPGAQLDLPLLRSQYADQLAIYARVLRLLHGGSARVHAALYYPAIPAFDWWAS